MCATIVSLVDQEVGGCWMALTERCRRDPWAASRETYTDLQQDKEEQRRVSRERGENKQPLDPNIRRLDDSQRALTPLRRLLPPLACE
jgi:hypothetical protein